MKNTYRVAVLIYPAGDEHLVFHDQPEVVTMETAPCTDASDITATAATVARRARQAIEDYEAPSDMDDNSDNV